MTATTGAVRCAEWALAQGVDPCGTAGHHDIFVAVEHPGPWPRDISDLPDLRAAGELGRSARVVVVAPRSDSAGGRIVTIWRRRPVAQFGAAAMVGVDHVLAPGADLGTDLLDVVDGTSASIMWSATALRDIFICSHGRRDRCCGRMGVQLQQSTADRWHGIRVRRSSHLGGHRFAPTAVTMPDNRWWAFLTVAALDRIVDSDLDGAFLQRHYRGLGLLDGRSQHAERHLLGIGASSVSSSFTHTESVATGRNTDSRIELEWTVGGNRRRQAVAVVGNGEAAHVPKCGTQVLEFSKSEESFQLLAIDLSPS